jgi:hypothetical protein
MASHTAECGSCGQRVELGDGETRLVSRTTTLPVRNIKSPDTKSDYHLLLQDMARVRGGVC